MTSKKCLVLNLKTKKDSSAVRLNSRDNHSLAKNALQVKVPPSDEVPSTPFHSTNGSLDFFGRNKDLLIPALQQQSMSSRDVSLNPYAPLPDYMTSHFKRYSDALSSMQAQAILSAAASRSSFPPFIPSSLPDAVAHNLLSVSGLLSQNSREAENGRISQEMMLNESMKHLLQVAEHKSKQSNDFEGRLQSSSLGNLDPANSKMSSIFSKQRPSIVKQEDRDLGSPTKKFKIDVPASIRDSIFGSRTFKPESDEDSRSQKGSSLDGDVLSVMMQGPGDNKKARVRSVLSEETLRILREQYRSNPRPKKHDILRLASQVNYSTRVVQVWFQNMRARDRRLGRPILGNGTSGDTDHARDGSELSSTPSLMIPQFNVDQTRSKDVVGSFHPIVSSRSPTSQPSMSKLPPNSGKVTDCPLDLSFRSTRSDDRDTDSSRDVSPSSSPILTNQSLQALGRFTKVEDNFRSLHSKLLDLPRLPKRPNSQQSDSELNDMQREAFDKMVKNSSIQQRQNLLASLGGNHVEKQWPNDNNNDSDDDTSRGSPSNDSSKGILAMVSRSHKDLTSMLRMNGEDSDGMEGNGVSSEPGGLFTCDQCDKTFSKQSSLARHKYEHSG